MALLEGDIIEVTLTGKLFTETCSNVFHYEATGLADDPDLENICVSFNTQVVSDWLGVISHEYTLETIRADNLTNELDFFVLGVVGSGAIVQDSTSSAVAGAIALRVSTKLTRPGSKRIAGVSESDMVGNEWQPEGVDQTALETALEGTLNLGQDDISVSGQMIHVIVGRFPIEHEDAGKIDISRFQPVSGVDFQTNVTTQTSRRANRGI